MLFDFTEAERNVARRALEIYVSELREEIVKTEKHEWRQALHEEKEILKPPRTTLVFDVSVRSDGMQANLRRANLRNGSPGSWPRQRLTNRRRFLKYLSAATRPSALRVGAC